MTEVLGDTRVSSNLRVKMRGSSTLRDQDFTRRNVGLNSWDHRRVQEGRVGRRTYAEGLCTCVFVHVYVCVCEKWVGIPGTRGP